MRRLVPFVLFSLACSHASLREVERFDQPDAAAAFEAMRHAAPAGVDPQERYATARAQMAAMRHYSTSDAFDRAGRAKTDSITVGSPWTFLGPGNIGGRTRALIFDPSTPLVMYAGGISGGVFKSTNGGESWTPIADTLANLDVSSLAIDPKDPNTIFASTGEGYFREDIRGTALPLRGDGIFVTHDAGATWSHLDFTASNDDFRFTNDVILSPNDSNTLYAATRTGVWRSRDAGTSWSHVLPATVKGGCLQVVIRPDLKDDTVFASCGVLEQATVYRNAAAQKDDSQWTSVLSAPGMSRTSLAIAPSSPSTIYALAANNNAGPEGTTQNLLAVFRSTQNGDSGTWTTQVSANDSDKLATTLLSNPISAMDPQCAGTQGVGDWVPMGWHCNVIAVDPKNPNRVFAAGVDVFRSDDGGKTWGVTSYWYADNTKPTFVHADQHVILFHPQYNGTANQTLFVANDGGIYRTDNAVATSGRGTNGECHTNESLVSWRALNHNYGVTQFYDGAVFPDGRRFIAGAQDNGTSIGSIDGGPDNWTMVWGGDGGFVAVDPVTANVMYAQSQNANIVKSTNGGQTFHPAPLPGSGTDDYLFVAPLVIDPNNHNRLWVGGSQMWRTDSAASAWNPASTSTDGKVSAIAVAPGRSDRVIAGTSSGAILRSNDATGASGSTPWLSTKPRDGFVSSIAFDPKNIAIVYTTYAGFGGTHVWRSTDSGATWSPVDNGLPDIAMHSLVVDPTYPGRLYLGTDLGIFVSLDNGASWMVESGLPSVLTDRVLIATGERGPAIYAFTHGRGAWRAELSAPVPHRRAASH